MISNYSAFIAFEFSHLLIFGVSMIYVLNTIVQSKRLSFTNLQWQRIAKLDPNQLIEDLDVVAGDLKKKNDGKETWMPLWVSMFTPGVDIWEDAEWKVFRLLFLKEFDLGTEFDYSKYVKRKLNTKLTHSLHIHPSTWGLVCIFSAVIWLGGTATGGSGADDGHRRLATVEEYTCDCWHENDINSIHNADYDQLLHYQLNETGGLQNCTEYIPPDGISRAGAIAGVAFPAVLGWFLLAMQGFVVWHTKSALHRVLRLKGCPSATDLPLFLRSLDAEVEMRQQLPNIPMFGGAGDDFLDDVMENLKLRFYNHGEKVFDEGDVGSSMFFICKGYTDVVSVAEGDKVIGSLQPGDYTGEMAILLDQPRSKAIVARTKCAVFELTREVLLDGFLKEEYPKAVSRMLDFAESRRQAALAGKWDKQQSLRKEDEDMVAEHSNRMKELQRAQAAAQDTHESEFPDGPSLEALGKLGKAGAGALVGAGGQLVGGVLSNPIQTTIKVTKTAAGAAGFPGMGAPKPNSGAHHHAHADRMSGAENIMPHERTHLYEELCEISLLFNCFTFGYYFLHIMPVVIRADNFGLKHVGMTETECAAETDNTWDYDAYKGYQCVSPDGTVDGKTETYVLMLICNFLIILPAILLMVVMMPIMTKYSCLLDNVLYKDEDTIAEVYHDMTRLISLKNAIKKQLTKVGLNLAHDKGIMTEISIDDIASMIFKELDFDNDGALTYPELRSGLTNFGVYLTKKEFKSMMEFVDPDFDRRVDVDEWVQFLACTDEQLASNEWLLQKQTVMMQKKLSSELTKKMMEMDRCKRVASTTAAVPFPVSRFTNPTRLLVARMIRRVDTGTDITDVDSFLDYMFAQLDADGGGRHSHNYVVKIIVRRRALLILLGSIHVFMSAGTHLTRPSPCLSLSCRHPE